jgi:hypothetical protein
VLYALATDDKRKLINQISQFVIDHGNDADELHDFLARNDIHYIYTGSRGGPISPQSLFDNSGYKSLYDSKGVRIFEILPVNPK